MKTSQHHIELYLDHFFKEPGFFLEIGAWKGDTLSQTLYLEREKGWQGVCVDPFPSNFEDRTCRVIARAISGDGTPREFVKVGIDRANGGDVSYLSGFRDSLGRHAPLIWDSCEYKIITVETVTPLQLFEEYSLPKLIEFLSVDVEGAELEFFEGLDFFRTRFGLIVFEHNENGVVRNGVGRILQEKGYVKFQELYLDDIYVAKDLL